MVVGFDAKRAVRNQTGLGNYSRLTIESVAGAEGVDRVLLYAPAPGDNPRLAVIRSLDNVSWRYPRGIWRAAGSLWRTWGIPGRLAHDGIDIYHGLSNELPLNICEAGIPSVVTVHDVIYRRLPQCYSHADRLLYDWKYGSSVRNATRVIAISRRTADDVTEYYGVDPEKIDVIYQGINPLFGESVSQDDIRRVRQRYAIAGRYIIQVGTIEYRKNLELGIRALTAIDPAITLVAVGRDRKGYLDMVMKIARSLGVVGRIKIIEGAPLSDLPVLYAGAEASLYPSRYEGFGLPVAESLAVGTPVVAATGSCLEEAGGDQAFYVGPDSVRDMASAVSSIISPGFGREAYAESARHFAKRFSGTGMAGAVLETYHKAMESACQ